MLVLTRSKDEEIILTCKDGTTITLKVLEINSGKCRIGFDAPKDVIIVRKEILDNAKSNETK